MECLQIRIIYLKVTYKGICAAPWTTSIIKNHAEHYLKRMLENMFIHKGMKVYAYNFPSSS